MTGREYHILIGLVDQLDTIARRKLANAKVCKDTKLEEQAERGMNIVIAARLEGEAAAYKDSADTLRLKLTEMNS
jgi:hypothetical protein